MSETKDRNLEDKVNNQQDNINKIHDEDNAQNGDLQVDRSNDSETLKETTPDNAKSKTNDKDRQRGKRMFGVLMGTLTKFQSEARNKSNGELKREEIEQKVNEKLQKEKEELSRQKEEERQIKIQRQEEILRMKLKKETEILETIREGYNNTKHLFLSTNTEPKIYFMPNKHTSVTENLLNQLKDINPVAEEPQENIE
ncbi:hypothetical protein K502DRAFT_362367 [Neoconidiobolus thromboides FSU 785]|nr:hypothetical protein K502DRAFT_362367 [Neoconidiobolus thromboides FSU 785]